MELQFTILVPHSPYLEKRLFLLIARKVEKWVCAIIMTVTTILGSASGVSEAIFKISFASDFQLII